MKDRCNICGVPESKWDNGIAEFAAITGTAK